MVGRCHFGRGWWVLGDPLRPCRQALAEHHNRVGSHCLSPGFIGRSESRPAQLNSPSRPARSFMGRPHRLRTVDASQRKPGRLRTATKHDWWPPLAESAAAATAGWRPAATRGFHWRSAPAARFLCSPAAAYGLLHKPPVTARSPPPGTDLTHCLAMLLPARPACAEPFQAHLLGMYSHLLQGGSDDTGGRCEAGGGAGKLRRVTRSCALGTFGCGAGPACSHLCLGTCPGHPAAPLLKQQASFGLVC
mmetsp:Transcript_46587/g.132847  ORF Transcript_46587/g.132847 Transcript_46587/m.132847 type:complete len:248 (+) Transcript_46587:338-1081(+)